MRLPLVLLFTASLLPAQAPRDAESLRTFFAENCTRCHGLDGSGLGPDGKRLKGADLTDSREMPGKKDEALAKTILKGVFFGMSMPAFGKQLSAEEAKLLVQEVVRKAQKGKAIGSPAVQK